MARRSTGSGVAVMAAALTLTACWPSPQQNPDRTSYNPSETTITQETVSRLAESWVAPVDDGTAGTPVPSWSAGPAGPRRG
jgi:hypothetical protein